jgi:hypothetical protein
MASGRLRADGKNLKIFDDRAQAQRLWTAQKLS